MKAETVVDLFQFIKAARVQRAGLVANKVQPTNCVIVKGEFRGKGAKGAIVPGPVPPFCRNLEGNIATFNKY